MSRHLTPEQKVNIIDAYTKDLIPMIQLADQYGKTRQAIWRIIKTAGIDIGAQSHIKVSCSACGKEITRHRHRLRTRVNHFCDAICYSAYLDAGNGHTYISSRSGQRFARAVVSKLFDLQPGQVVHHEDHNTPNNLRVFKNQGDHIRYHRLGADYSPPIWDGSK